MAGTTLIRALGVCACLSLAVRAAAGACGPCRQVTTHPGDDTQPVCARGAVLFVSDRSGNPDIWLHDADERVTRRVTDASAADVRPAVSADGAYLAFVSTREDAGGDVWTVRLRSGGRKPAGRVRKLGVPRLAEDGPAWSPDRKTLVYAAGPAGERDLWLAGARGRNRRLLVRGPASAPHWSPAGTLLVFVRPDARRGGTALCVVTPAGRERKLLAEGCLDLAPKWSPDGSEIAFARRSLDTDNSGTVDLADRAAVFVLRLADGALRQLTDYGASAADPCWSPDGRTVYFSWDRSGNRDIWSVPAEGAVRTAASVAAQLAQAGDRAAGTWERLLAYTAVWNRHHDAAASGAALRRASALLYDAGLTYAARAYLGRVHVAARDVPEERGLAAVAQVVHDTAVAASGRTGALTDILDDYGAYPRVCAAAYLARGRLRAVSGDDDGALADLAVVAERYGTFREEAARARLLTGDIYVRFGDTEQVLNIWLQACRDYRDLPGIPEEAAGRVAGLLAGHGSEPVGALRPLVERFRNGYPVLAARLQLRIAGHLRGRDDPAGAARACGDAVALLDAAGRPSGAAALQCAAFLYAAGRITEAETRYRQLAAAADSSVAAGARTRLVALLDDAGEALLAGRDVQLAEARFLAAAKVDYADPRAHRGLVDCYAARGRAAEIAAKYENRVYYHPESAIDHYALGYACTYLADRAHGKKLRRLYDRAVRHLELARRFRPDNIYTYLTLGFVYEMMEKRGVAANELLYERAVETQRMGLELNDGEAEPLLEADLCQNIANNCEKLGMYGQAVRYYGRALDLGIRFRAPLQKLSFYRNLGVCLARTDRYEEAVDRFGTAFVLADSLGAHAWRIELSGRISLACKQLADMYRETARTFEQQAAFDRAMELLDRADAMYDRANRYNRMTLDASAELQLSEPDMTRHAEQENVTKRDMALNKRQLGEYRDAVRYAREAQALIDHDLVRDRGGGAGDRLRIKLFWFIPVSLPMPGFTIGGSRASAGFPLFMQSALNYSVIGQSMVQLGDYRGALDAYRAKLALYRRRGDPAGKAVLLNNIGYLFHHQLQPDSADAYFSAAAALCRTNNLVFGERTALFNRCAVTQERLAGKLADGLGVTTADIRRAAALAERGLALCGTGGDSVAFDNAAGVVWRYGVRALDEGLLAVPGRYGDAPAARTLLRDGWLARAAFRLERALVTARRHGLRRYALRVSGNLASVRFALGYAEQAAGILEEAVAKARAEAFSGVEWRLCHAMASVRSAEGTSEGDAAACMHLRRAVEVLEAEPRGTGYTGLSADRTPFADEMERTARSDRFALADVYADLVECLMRRNEPAAALAYAERGYAYAAADMFRGAGLPFLKRYVGRELDRNFLGWVLAYEDDVERLKLSVHRARYRGGDAAELMARLRDAEERLAAHIRTAAAENDPVVSLVRPRTVPVDSVRALLDDRTAVVTYALERHTLHIWVTDRHGTSARTVAGADSLPAMAAAFRALIRTGDDISRVNAAAGALYRLLMAPVQPSLEGHDRLVVVPAPELYGLPFSALHDGGGYMAERFAVTVCPSMTFWYDSYRRRNVNGARMLGAFVRGEPDSLPAPFRAAGTTVLAGPELTEAALGAALEGHDVIHLEVPGVMGGRNPLSAGFGLPGRGNAAADSGTGTDDGVLYVYELLRYRLRAGLMNVVFTGLDRSMGAREWMLLALSAGYAGVPTLLHNLWLEDPELRRETAELMYGYARKYPLDDALTEVKLDLMEKYRHPRFWAGLRLVGYGGMDRGQMRDFAARRFNRMAQLGVAAQKRGKWDDAYRYFSTAAAMARELGREDMMPRIQSALVTYAYRMGDYDKAVYHQRQLLGMAPDDAATVKGLRQLVRFLTAAGRYDEALDNEFRLRRRAADDPAAVAGSFSEAAGILLAAGRHDGAVAAADTAAARYRALGDPAADDAALLAVRILLDRGRYADALERLQPLLDAAGGNGTDRYVRALQYAGFCLEKLGDYEEAVLLQERALGLLPGDGADELRIRGHQYLANCRWYTGALNDAVRHQRTALALARQTGNTAQELLALSTFGLIQLSLGQPGKALEMEKRALELARGTGAADGMAAAHNNLGLVFRHQGNEPTALAHFRQALRIDRDAGLERGLAYDYRNIGISYERMGDMPKAGTYLVKALEISRNTGNRENEAKVLYSLGTVTLAQGVPERAETYLTQALGVAEDMGLQDIRWRVLRRLGGLYADRNRTEQARERYLQAIGVVESMRARLKIEEYKTGFMDGKLDVYRDLVLLLLDAGKPEEAFGIAERAKSRNFLDLLGNRTFRFADAASDSLAGRERTLKQRIGALGRRLVLPWADTEALNARLDSLKQAYAGLLVRIRETNPRLASMVAVDPATAVQVRGLLAPGTALIEYFQAGNRLAVWCVTPDRITAKTVDVGDTALNARIGTFRNAIRTLAPLDEEARELYDLLIGPVDGLLDEGIERVCIVPHGGLHYLPFAALQRRDGTYLLERFSLFGSPSASVLRHCLGAEPRPRTAVLALGNPDLGNPAFDLPFAQKEVESIRWQYPEHRVFLRGEVTEARVREFAGGADIVHFACHGEFDDANPLFSALLLAPDGADDGRLEVNEIFGLNLHASLVTLSACETGLGKIEKGDDVVGLTRAFITAGTPAIIASLWKISDVASAVLIKRFYRYLKQEDAVDALRRAQLFIKDKYPHPAYWASFMLSGDYR